MGDNCKLLGKTVLLSQRGWLFTVFPRSQRFTLRVRAWGLRVWFQDRPIETSNSEPKVIVIPPRSARRVIWLNLEWLREEFRIRWLCCYEAWGSLATSINANGITRRGVCLRILCCRWKVFLREHCQLRR
jgi:hypothetical protein